MKRRISFLLFSSVFVFQLHAQSVFYGLTWGNNGFSTIAKYDPLSNVLTAAYQFENQDYGSAPADLEFVEGVDGKFYGTTKKGGIHHVGVLFSFDPSTNSYQKVYDLPNTPTAVLTKGNGSMIYGTTDDHIFSFNTATRIYTIRHVFTPATGSAPLSGLTLGADNKFYGTTSAGGINSKGVIYKFDTITNSYTKLLDFTNAQGVSNWGLTLGPNNLLYGTTSNGTLSSTGSILYSFDTNISSLQDLFHFNSQTAFDPSKRLTYGSDGKLYGVSNVGPEIQGCVFSFDPATNIYATVTTGDPAGPDNTNHFVSSLTLGNDGKLYGINDGGHHADGLIYSYDPSTKTFTSAYHFDTADPEQPNGRLIQGSNGKFYAAIIPSVISNAGVPQGKLFSFNPTDNLVDYVYLFSSHAKINGANPYNSLIKGNGNNLLGMTNSGGIYNGGVIFSYNPFTEAYTKLHDFDGINGQSPLGNLIYTSNGKIYGATTNGGTSSGGVLFSLDPTNNDFAKLYDFTHDDGFYPYGSLTEGSDRKLYGTTNLGGVGNSNSGVLFSFDPSSNTYSKLFQFTATTGANPTGITKGPDGKFYGLTSSQGAMGGGTIFSFDPSSSTFTKWYDFNSVDGFVPQGELFLASDGKFYGLTTGGGTTSSGTIFSFDPVTHVYTKLYDFIGGEQPFGTLTQDDDGLLYGMTEAGGANTLGVVFSYNISTKTYTKLQDFDGVNGSHPFYGSLIKVSPGTKYVKVNLYGGSNPYNNSEWNNWNSSSSISSGALKYSDGTSTSISATLSQQTGMADNGTGYNSTMAPPEVVRYASYSTTNRTLTISGLSNTKIYNLEIYASRKGTTNNTTRFTIGSTTIDVVTDNNLSNKASFVSLSTVSGTITVNISKLNSYNYINGFVLSEASAQASNAAPVVNAGNDQTITLPTTTVQITGSATDPDGTITSYNWTEVSGPSQFSFNDPTVPNLTVSNLVQGSYIFRLTVYDNQGATSYDDVQITVNPATIPTKYVKVNLYGGVNPFNHPEWNNWNSSSSLSSGALKYSDGTSSSISATLSQQTGIADNGTGYNSTMAPPEVVRYASYSTSNRAFTISGLDNTKTYNLELYASRKGATNNTTRFTIGASLVDILTDNNLTSSASFTSITPSSGQIVVSISKLNAYNYLNGFVLTENGSSSPITKKIQSQPDAILLSSISTYPNPATDQIIITVNNNYTGQMKVQIIDMRGTVVKEFRLSKNYKGVSQNYLSVKDLTRGEYLVRIETGNSIETKKLLKL